MPADADFPYADRFPVHRTLPEQGRPRAEVLAELEQMGTEEDRAWEGGRVSGTMYCGDHEHYDYLTEAFGRFAHVNALQRDLCPSVTRFEGEVIAMTLDLMHADSVTDRSGGGPAGLVTTGGSGSILHAVLAYREQAHAAGNRTPNLVKPETGHVAFDKACHLLGVELRTVPVDPVSTLVTVEEVAKATDDATMAIVGSAGNYPYGTVDPIADLGALALERGVGLHVDACLGGFILPFGEELGYAVPPFDFRVPGVTTISADTHKYGYALKGTSVLLFRDKALRNGQFFHQVSWSGGKYMSPSLEGSRSGGLLAATWASMVHLGRDGYRRYAADIFGTAEAMMRVVGEQDGLRILGEPTFCFSFTADEFDIYHVADHMRPKGWRFNGQQYPNAIHMAVTRPQTQPGVVEAFEADLVAAVAYAREQSAAGVAAESGAIYGGVPGGLGGLTDDVTGFIEQVMDSMLDTQMALPPAVSRLLVLTVDLGSGGPKVGYVTTRGEVVWWWYERSYALESVGTQDAEDWWRTVVTAARRGQVEGGVDGSDVVAVAVTGQWASTVPVDGEGRPVAECLMWSDTRGAAYSKAIFGGPVSGYAPGPLALWVRRTGGIPSPHGCDPVAHMLHLSRDRSEVAAAARWYLEPVDYLTMRFTGVAAATHMSMMAAWLTDNRDLGRLSYDDKLVATAGVDPDKLPPLVRGGSVVGTVLPAVADELGIPSSAQVVNGTPDLQSAVVGTGCVGVGQAHLTLGTTAWISCPVAGKKSDVVRQMASLPGLGTGYVLGNSQDNAGRALEWFASTVLPGASYDEIEALAATAPAGAGGVLFTPWLTGERSPVDDKHARAGFHNVALTTTRADLARAVLEGVAFNLRWLLEGAEHFTRTRLDPLRVLGGAARMDLWCQVVADVLDRTLERVDQPLVGGLRGAGLYAGLALGDVTLDQLHSLVPVDRVFTPDPATRATYDRLAPELPRLYRRQKRLFARLNGGG